jgi:hypothetical protein
MNRRYADSKFVPDRSAAPQSLVAGGFWLRAGSCGAIASAASLYMFVNAEAGPANALLGALAGALFAAFAWRRAWLTLECAEAQPGASAASAMARRYARCAEPAVTR